MKLFLSVCISLFFFGCAPISKGDYVIYSSDEYLFMQDGFLDKNIKCLELGKLKDGDLNLKYCVGQNYASSLVQGFIFEHDYRNVEERFIGAKLSFEAKHLIRIPCSSEVIEHETSGKEYVNCMVPQRSFDIYNFIVNSRKEVHGEFKAPVGNMKVYRGVIDEKGKKLLIQFYEDMSKQNKVTWKKANL